MKYDDFNDAVIAAHHQAKKDGCAYAVQWPLGHSTVEARKPSLRDRPVRVIECRLLPRMKPANSAGQKGHRLTHVTVS